MSTPNTNAVHADAHLSTFAAGYTNGDLIADIVCPVIKTDKLSDLYQTLRRQDMADDSDDLVLADDGEATEVGYEQGSGSFNCISYAAKARASYAGIKNQDLPIVLLEQKTAIATHKVLLKRERRVATLLTTAGSYAAGNTGAVGTVWTDPAADVLGDIDTGIAAIAPGTVVASKLVFWCTKEVWNTVKKHPSVLAGGSTSAALNKQQFAELIGVDEVVVTESQVLTSNRGQTPTYARIWSATSCGVVRVPVSDPQGVTGLFAATFRFMVEGDGVDGIAVRRWFDPAKGRGGSEVVQVEHSDDEVAVQNDLGYLWTSVR